MNNHFGIQQFCNNAMDNSKAKICIFSSAHPAFDGRIFHKQAKTLAKAGYNVSLIVQHDKDEIIEGIKIISLPMHANRFKRMTECTLQAFRLALKEKADIYHFHDPELLPAGIILKVISRAKIIYDVHEDYPDYIRIKRWIPFPFRVPLSIIMDKIEMVTAKIFDAIITADEGVAARFAGRQKTVILYNFPDISIFQNSLDNSDTPKYDIIYLGGLSLSRLIFMFSVGLELKNMGHSFHWCILGCSRKLSEIGWRELANMNLTKHFELIDRIPYTEVAKYIKDSRIGIIPFPYNKKLLKNIPTKLFEYMLFGLPVVASNLPPTAKFVENEDCALLVEPENASDFADAIGYLLANPDKAEAMGKRGKSLVENRYNWSFESKKLIELYEHLLIQEEINGKVIACKR